MKFRLLTVLLACAALAPAQKKAMIVDEFDYSAVMTSVQAIFGTQMNIGQGIQAMLVKRVAEGGKFTVVERKKIGRVLSVDVHSDGAAAERCKGSCVVHFATADEANYAVGMLNDYEWLGERKIRARLAKEAATVGERAPGPVIVNGTTHGGQ